MFRPCRRYLGVCAHALLYSDYYLAYKDNVMFYFHKHFDLKSADYPY